MMSEFERVISYGTPELPLIAQRLAAGSLSMELVQGSIQKLCWDGIEIVRAIDCLARDDDWATCSARIAEQRVTRTVGGFECTQQRVVADGALTCSLLFNGCSDGIFRASAELMAHRDFYTNRTGFIVLHPLDGLVGSSLLVRGNCGEGVWTTVPIMISPRQLARDIAGLEYRVCDVKVSIRFSGDVFEMEDQRNWSDASFKTYCRPLSLPVPYVIRAGETVRQEIGIRISGTSRTVSTGVKVIDAGLQLAPLEERVPVIAIALDSLSAPDSTLIPIARMLEPTILQLRVDSKTANTALSSAEALTRFADPQIELEVVVPKGSELDRCLGKVAEQCRDFHLRIARVLALPEAYLKSYQPSGPWPEGPTPIEACLAARRWFPVAQVGGGVLTHFAEFNRCRPDPSICDYVSHGSMAIVHAADDRSVGESLQGLSHIYVSGRAIAGTCDYRLGLVSIGMRSNPYGRDVMQNPGQIRLPMSRVDPRQRALFAAAWVIGAVAATEGCNVISLALASFVGPFGVIYRRASWPQPIYDECSDAVVYPLFHSVRALLQMGGAARLSVGGIPRGVAAVAAESGSGTRLVLANPTEDCLSVRLPYESEVRRLDGETFQAATRDPDWLHTSKSERRRDASLGPFNVAFIDMPGASL